MKLVAAIKNIFSRLGRKADPNQAPYDPLKTVSIIEKMRSDGDDEVRPLPIVGVLQPKHQMSLFVAVMIGALILFGVAVIFESSQANNNAIYRTRSTEMQMLSQQIARSASQAVLAGNAQAFETLDKAYKKFADNQQILGYGGEGVPGSYGAAIDVLDKIEVLWKSSFAPSDKPTINTILTNKELLVSTGKGVANINKNDAKLLQLSQELVESLERAGASKNMINLAYEQVMLTQRMAKNANAALAVEVIDSETVVTLGTDAKKFSETLTGMLDGNPEVGLSPVSDVESQTKLKEISVLFKEFETFVNLFTYNADKLEKTREANQTVNKESDTLLALSGDLTSVYEAQSKNIYITIAQVLLIVISAFALFLLIKVYNSEAQRRRLESERENKRNQEAILRLLNEMSDLADGDLTVRASVTEDLTGAIPDSMNYTIEELRNLITNINRATEQVTAASQQAQSISDGLLEAAQRQSDEILDANGSVQHMARSINDVSASAAESARVAQQSLAAAEKGTTAVQNAISGMNEIREQIQETAKRIKRLGESSQEIGEIVELISDITEQTNVLALNAAIQAASAGEAGRGFTVVAEEVQRLAERSAEATKQIGAIVKTIQTDTHDAVAAMEVSTHGVVEGAKLSDAAGQALSEIGQVSHNLAELIETISSATREQTDVAEKVSRSMLDILNITEQTTNGTRETAVQIGQLTSLAAELKGSVAGFKLE